jgi:hypothetical protein
MDLAVARALPGCRTTEWNWRRRWLDTYRPKPDRVDPVDQLMLVRHHGDKLYLPQRPEIAAAIPLSDRTGR